MDTPIPVAGDRKAGIFTYARERSQRMWHAARAQLCVMDARMRTLSQEPEEGAATAEYAVVLVAATGFAAVLVALLKSSATKNLLNEFIKKALSIV